MNCPRCQHENETGAKFCEECAAPLARTCARCGRHLSETAKFCSECAHPVTSPAEAPTPSTTPRFTSPEAYTPKHLAERILTSKAALEGERKQVTVLFADLKGSMELLADRDPEEARKILDPVLELMMEAVHQYEGTVNQVMGDGIMALFGAPLAHEDHALRACYAALRMQEAVSRHAQEARRAHGVNVQIRVGLNSGEVVVRALGSDLRMDYTAVGQTTHLAARMEQLASPGSVLLTPSTLALVEGYIAVKPLGPVPVKGLADPVDVYEVTGADRARTRLQATARRGLTRFVGRDAELEQLRRAQQLVGSGHGQVVAIVGEAGVGKSRLLHEFTHSHRLQGWLTLESASVSYGRATTYLPVIELLKSYLKIQDRDDLREIREKVTGKLLALDPALEPALPALLALLGLPVDDPSWQALDPPRRRERTLDAVRRLLLREAREQPLLLIVEDLHWIDSETQALLDGLVESLGSARLLLLVNYRPEYQHAWGGKTYYSQMRLDALPAESAAALLEALLGADPSLAPLKERLVKRGNPFFLEETVRTLVETKTLAGQLGQFRLTRPLQAIQIPATVQAILAARIDRLAPDDKRLLQVASVVGKDVPLALLQVIADLSEDSLHRGLERLQRAEFLYETGGFPDREYSFTHALTHEVTYGGLLQERRRVLHARVLEALEQPGAGRKQEQIEQLAHHAVRGQLWDRAARYLYQAGEKALAEAGYRAAATFYETAMEALERLGEAADRSLYIDVCLELWSARSVFGQYEGSRELGEKAEGLARALGDGPRLAQVQLRQAQAISFSGVMPGTLPLAIEKAREAFDRADPSDLRTRSYARFIVGYASRDLGRLEEALREFDAGLALFEPVDRHGQDAGLVFPICVSLGAWRAETYAALGEFRQALASAREALGVATEIHHASSLSVGNMYVGMVHVRRGELEAGVPFLERGLAIAGEHGLHLAILRAGTELAHALVMLGERDRGLEVLASARARSDVSAHHGSATGYGTVTASTYLAAGCPTEARVEIQNGLAAVAERNARGHLAPLLRLEAELLTREDVAGAGERLQEALATAVELRMRPEAAHCHLGLAKLYREAGQRAEAREHLTIAATMYREMAMRFWSERAEAELKDLA
ncbi:MAG TPA: adenylate/guanylate cyclase domain-containing protein [Methylomirabilota bacterium]|nr:adenylate/guanylate cyclase domain-containing protein [Methylomirabilota bacterium]